MAARLANVIRKRRSICVILHAASVTLIDGKQYTTHGPQTVMGFFLGPAWLLADPRRVPFPIAPTFGMGSSCLSA
jgi:hypothetical protein